MGQGTFTALPAVLADELDADWAKVKPVYPPEWNEKKYGNPGLARQFQTTAQLATRGYFKPMRIAGAQARRVLLDAVAAKWNVPVGELSTEPSVVVHKASNRRMATARSRASPRCRPSCPRSRTRTSSRRRASATSARMCRASTSPRKVTGAAIYGIDVQVPGMVYAAVLQSPYQGGTPATIDDAAARAVPGVTDVVRLPAGVAVVGNTVEATQAAKKLLKVTWTDAPAAHHDSERALADFAAIARDKPRRHHVTSRRRRQGGDGAAARVFRGEYRTRYIYHAQMEPMNATATVAADGKSAEIWVGTQNPTGLHNEVARLLRHRAQQDHVPPACAGRRLTAGAAPAGRGARGGAPVQGRGQAGQGDLEPRGRPCDRQVPADDRAAHRGRLRCRRQARGLAPSRGRRVGAGLSREPRRHAAARAGSQSS